jgi:hypothetical protein
MISSVLVPSVCDIGFPVEPIEACSLKEERKKNIFTHSLSLITYVSIDLYILEIFNRYMRRSYEALDFNTGKDTDLHMSGVSLNRIGYNKKSLSHTEDSEARNFSNTVSNLKSMSSVFSAAFNVKHTNSSEIEMPRFLELCSLELKEIREKWDIKATCFTPFCIPLGCNWAGSCDF